MTDKKEITAELIPCPFCGSDPEWINEALADSHFYIRCSHCRFVMKEDRRDKVIGMWNTRTDHGFRTIAKEVIQRKNPLEMNIITFIRALRETDDHIKHIFMRGGCYQFHLLLKLLFPECEPCINHTHDHVVSLFKGRLYDIEGVNRSGDFRLMTASERRMAARWSFSNNYLLKITECPYCEEPITYNIT
jgi:Lar family restriction alleviation protein